MGSNKNKFWVKVEKFVSNGPTLGQIKMRELEAIGQHQGRQPHQGMSLAMTVWAWTKLMHCVYTFYQVRPDKLD